MDVSFFQYVSLNKIECFIKMRKISKIAFIKRRKKLFFAPSNPVQLENQIEGKLLHTLYQIDCKN